mmetsp:Transcript_12324/g.18296  ORF Transcript_12324/g.18296 Transcript_12324/m.18296 type:complete len:227 (-) Transcript_12324:38-718(-)
MLFNNCRSRESWMASLSDPMVRSRICRDMVNNVVDSITVAVCFLGFIPSTIASPPNASPAPRITPSLFLFFPDCAVVVVVNLIFPIVPMTKKCVASSPTLYNTSPFSTFLVSNASEIRNKNSSSNPFNTSNFRIASLIRSSRLMVRSAMICRNAILWILHNLVTFPLLPLLPADLPLTQSAGGGQSYNKHNSPKLCPGFFAIPIVRYSPLPSSSCDLYSTNPSFKI